MFRNAPGRLPVRELADPHRSVLIVIELEKELLPVAPRPGVLYHLHPLHELGLRKVAISIHVNLFERTRIRDARIITGEELPQKRPEEFRVRGVALSLSVLRAEGARGFPALVERFDIEPFSNFSAK